MTNYVTMMASRESEQENLSYARWTLQETDLRAYRILPRDFRQFGNMNRSGNGVDSIQRKSENVSLSLSA